MMAAATVAARTIVEIPFRRNPAQFERFGNGFLNEMLHLVQLFLRLEKSTSNGILHQGVAMFFEVGDFSAFERLRPRLFFLKRLTFAHHHFILAARCLIGLKSINLLAGGAQVRQINDGLAKLTGLLRDGIFFNLSRHKMCQFSVLFSNARPFFRTQERHNKPQ